MFPKSWINGLTVLVMETGENNHFQIKSKDFHLINLAEDGHLSIPKYENSFHIVF